MSENSKIEWCDATFNPWWGCEKVSPGCAHCYADTLSKRYARGAQLWGDGHTFRFFGDKHWAEPLKWARTLPAKLGRRPRVFCASMADVFEERAELEEPRLRLFSLIEETPELDWLVLTKRPEFALEALRPGGDIYWGDFRILPNLWLGVSIENSRFTWRADILREIPAAVRFISAEPLLGSLFPTGPFRLRDLFVDAEGRRHGNAPLDLTGIDWVIAGGESGHHARPSHPDWFREIRDACVRQTSCDYCSDESNDAVHAWGMCVCDCHPGRPAFFFKQWGAWVPSGFVSMRGSERFPKAKTTKVGDWSVFNVGKNVAGRELDGATWDQFPRSAA